MPEDKAVVLDTHVWFWLATGDANLSTSARRLLESTSRSGSIYIPAICMWEIAMLNSLGRIELHMPADKWLANALSGPGLKLAPLTPEIAADSCNLPGKFHKDPADRLIVSTARMLRLALVTKDSDIIEYSKKNHLKTISG